MSTTPNHGMAARPASIKFDRRSPPAPALTFAFSLQVREWKKAPLNFPEDEPAKGHPGSGQEKGKE